jgi:6-pyruvoyltetrahydropterin/6-carboxytetrahydropterin synthase
VDEHTGFVLDFNDIDVAFKPIHDQIDHSYLNKIDGLDNPSSENLCKWIWAEIIPSLPGLFQIEIKETDSTGCIYKGE